KQIDPEKKILTQQPHPHTHTYTHTHTCTHAHTHTHPHTPTHPHPHTHTYTHTHTHARTHTHTHLPLHIPPLHQQVDLHTSDLCVCRGGVCVCLYVCLKIQFLIFVC